MQRLHVLKTSERLYFPSTQDALREPNGLLCVGGDLSLERLILAYRSGIFPWFSKNDPILWWSPDPRMIFRTELLTPNSRTQRILKKLPWQLSADNAFNRVIRACAEPRPEQNGTWIDPRMIDAYEKLHHAGIAHSIEVWEHKPGESQLIGGIYGLCIGRVFFGESMFSRKSNASKAALFALAKALHLWHCPIIDAQVESAHLLSLGAEIVPRNFFVEQIQTLCVQTTPNTNWRQSFPIQFAAELSQTLTASTLI